MAYVAFFLAISTALLTVVSILFTTSNTDIVPPISFLSSVD